MTTLKYLHKDGAAKIYSGFSQEELEGQPFCDRIFGPLERPLERDERINSVDGSIEKIPPTQEALDRADAKTKFEALTAAQIDAAGAAELKVILKAILRHLKARGL